MKKIKRLLFSFKYVFLIILLYTFIASLWAVMKPSTIKNISDAWIHLGYLIKLDNSIKDGVFLPRWVSNSIMGKYGSPKPIFYSPLYFYIAESFVLVNFGFIDAMKITLFLGFLLSGLTMYLFMRSIFDDLVGFTSAIVYMYSAFSFFLSLSFNFIPQQLTFIFLPLILWALNKTYEKKSMKHFIITAVSFSLLILEHTTTALIFTPIIFIYLFCLFILKKRDKKGLFYGVAGILIGVGITSFFWFPALVEYGYTYFKYQMEFIDINQQLDISSFLNHFSIIQILIISIFSLFLFILFLKRSYKFNKNLLYLSIFSILVLLISIFMNSSLSRYLWENELIKIIQNPFRFLIIGILSTSIMSGIIISKYKIKKYKFKIIFSIILIVLTILFTIPEIKDAIDTVTDKDNLITCNQYPKNNILSENSGNEFLPIWVNEEPEFKQKFDVIEGNVSIGSFEERTQYISFSTKSDGYSKIVVNEFWYPGWTGYINQREVDLNRTDNGLISLNIPMGNNKIELKFENTEDRNIGDYFSLFVIVMLLIAIIKRYHSIMGVLLISVVVLIITTSLIQPLSIPQINIRWESYFKNIKYPITIVPILNNINESNLEKITYGDDLSKKVMNQCYVGCDNVNALLNNLYISDDFGISSTQPSPIPLLPAVIQNAALQDKNKYILIIQLANSRSPCSEKCTDSLFKIKILDCSSNEEEMIYEDVINGEEGWKTIPLDISRYVNKTIIFKLDHYAGGPCGMWCSEELFIKKFYIGKLIK
jgi:hypothetical protein